MVQKETTRPRRYRMDVWATKEEVDRIDALAKSCGMSRSRYMREVSQSYQPKSILDHKCIHELIKTRGDLGRAGGLLKLWLSERKGEGTRPINVRKVLNQFESLQQQMARIVLNLAKLT